jgi:hypothetical protein
MNTMTCAIAIRGCSAKLGLVAVATILAVAAIPTSVAARDRAQTKTITRTWFVRWPAPNRSRYWVLQMPEPLNGARSGHIYINGFQIDTTFARSTDYIVACAHRGPAFASGTLHRATGTIYALVVLTGGDCLPPGPSVAGTLTRVKVVLIL